MVAHDNCCNDNCPNVGVELELIPSFAGSMRIIRAHRWLVDNEHNLKRRRHLMYAHNFGQKGVHQYAEDVAPIGKFSFVKDERLERDLRLVVWIPLFFTKNAEHPRPGES